MEFIGGFVGVSQDPETLAVCPAIGWAVNEGTSGSTPSWRIERRALADGRR